MQGRDAQPAHAASSVQRGMSGLAWLRCAGGLTGGGGSGPSHLIPLQAAGGAQFDPGLVCAMLPLHGGGGGGGGQQQQQFTPESASAMFVAVRRERAGRRAGGVLAS